MHGTYVLLFSTELERASSNDAQREGKVAGRGDRVVRCQGEVLVDSVGAALGDGMNIDLRVGLRE
jgi:hypothetical protein